MFRTLMVVVVVGFSSTAFAQSSLGITGAEFTFGQMQDESGNAQGSVTANVNVAVTEFHGFQGGLSFADTEFGAVGTLETRLYMTPHSGQKYGLFATISDVDGRAFTWGSIGAEGQFLWADDSVFGVRAGLGAANTGGLDYIFGGISIARAISPELEIETSIDLAEFDEASFRAISYDAGIVMRYNFNRSPLGMYASLNRSGLTGRDGTGGETRIGLGISVSLGTAGGIDPHTRKFRQSDPVSSLVRRGFY